MRPEDSPKDLIDYDPRRTYKPDNSLVLRVADTLTVVDYNEKDGSLQEHTPLHAKPLMTVLNDAENNVGQVQKSKMANDCDIESNKRFWSWLVVLEYKELCGWVFPPFCI